MKIYTQPVTGRFLYPQINLLTCFKIIVLLFLTFSGRIVVAQGNNFIEISGKVVNQDTKEALDGVSVEVKGTISGTATNNTGEFTLRTRNKFPLTLVFSSVGFQQQEFEVKSINSKLTIALVTQTLLGK